MTDSRFKNQVAIITGGGDGIGRAVAHRLATEGAKVVLFDISREKLDKALSDFKSGNLPAEAQAVDISDDLAVKKAMQRIVDTYGKLDVLVHCAGIVGPNNKPITQVDVEDFDKVYNINLRGSFIVTKHALAHMKDKNYGRILLFASIAGKEGNSGMVSYSATKAGVIGLVKSVGKEFAGTGITVNAIAPAVIRTALVDGMEPAQVKYMTDKIPMQRCGTLEEVAALSSWIVSTESSFNTGVTFDLTGGRATY